MKHVVVFSGAGISAESGIKTFRDADGLWENHAIEEVATPEAFERNPELVLRFYNERRKQLLECKPNDAHNAIAELENKYKVTVVTQNVDDLHERAGSTNVIHLHGELMKVRSTAYPALIYKLDSWELKLGDNCEKGFQLRPHIVWFGEQVPMMDKAMEVVEQADIFLVVGTSLQVYPAAGLVHYAIKATHRFLIDPKSELPYGATDFTLIRSTAVDGVRKVLAGI
ncbi:MAG: SIR2 family NAD-dependent protein deacylase [Bacteroidota bacterium]